MIKKFLIILILYLNFSRVYADMPFPISIEERTNIENKTFSTQSENETANRISEEKKADFYLSVLLFIGVLFLIIFLKNRYKSGKK